MIFCCSTSASGGAGSRLSRQRFDCWRGGRSRRRRGRWFGDWPGRRFGANAGDGRQNRRLVAASPSARFGRGFFSSINDSVSMAGFFAGLGASASFGGCSGCARVLAVARSTPGVMPWTDFRLDALRLFALRLRRCLDRAARRSAALTGLRAVAGLRAAVLVVVFVGILVPENRHGWPISGKPVYCAAGSPDEWPHGFHAPSLRPRKESRPGLRPPHRAILRDW